MQVGREYVTSLLMHDGPIKIGMKCKWIDALRQSRLKRFGRLRLWGKRYLNYDMGDHDDG